jgi:hypothetical protein
MPSTTYTNIPAQVADGIFVIQTSPHAYIKFINTRAARNGSAILRKKRDTTVTYCGEYLLNVLGTLRPSSGPRHLLDTASYSSVAAVSLFMLAMDWRVRVTHSAEHGRQAFWLQASRLSPVSLSRRAATLNTVNFHFHIFSLPAPCELNRQLYPFPYQLACAKLPWCIFLFDNS